MKLKFSSEKDNNGNIEKNTKLNLVKPKQSKKNLKKLETFEKKKADENIQPIKQGNIYLT